jgi:type III secretion protein J
VGKSATFEPPSNQVWPVKNRLTRLLFSHLWLLPVLTLSVSACGVDAVVHNVDEREANHVVEILADGNISATKLMVDTGRSVSFTISVPSGSRVEATKLLNRNQLPRRPESGYLEIFKDGGLIPTAGEERAKQLAAIEGEIEKQLHLIDGILDSQVQLVIPEETALRTAQDVRAPTTASVTIKYLPGLGGAKPLSEPQVQAVVAAGVERLTPDNVVVVMTPALASTRIDGDRNSGASLKGASSRQMNMALFGLGAVVLLSILAVFALLIRLNTVRGRLTRLQNEIAKARRKPGDTPPPAIGA